MVILLKQMQCQKRIIDNISYYVDYDQVNKEMSIIWFDNVYFLIMISLQVNKKGHPNNSCQENLEYAENMTVTK